MPTVPSTCRPLSSLVNEGIYIPGVIDHIDTSGVSGRPTPDPDLDDEELVPVVTGDGIGAITMESSLRDESGASSLPQKPSLVIEDLSLHSPSSIVGTPFDVSPRFEYPFPSDIPEPPPTVLPIHASLAIQFSAFPNTTTVASPTLTLSNPPPRESRGFLATHPKLQTREPPIPPGLSKKRWSLSMSAPGRPRLRTRSSGDSIPKAPPTTTRPGSLGLGKP